MEVASYYVLFGVMGASRGTLVVEIVVASVFMLFAILGYKRNLWLVVAAIVGPAFLTTSIISSSKTLGYRLGGPASVWHSMLLSSRRFRMSRHFPFSSNSINLRVCRRPWNIVGVKAPAPSIVAFEVSMSISFMPTQFRP